jgi:Uncharacterized conserved protein
MDKSDHKTLELDPKLLTIAELFNGEACYTVPIYQRNYAWQMDQIEQMLRDIQDALNDQKKSYFLGNLIVTLHQCNDGSKDAPYNYDVIDGQQRLTTLYLLLRLLGHSNDQRLLQYKSRPRATAALEHIAQEDPDLAAPSVAEQDREDAAIRQGYKIIEQYLKQHLKGDTQNFTDFLLKNVSVVRATLPTGTDFNRYFEIMNTRGQQLQQVDIVKARMMAYLKEDERACFAWIWNACAEMDSYVQMTLTSKDTKDTKIRTKIFGDNWSFVSVVNFNELMTIRRSQSSATASFADSGGLGLAEAIIKYSTTEYLISEEDMDNARFRSIITFPVFLLHVLKIVRDDAIENEGHLDDKTLVKRFTEFLKVKDASNDDEAREKVKRFAFELLRCRNLFDSYIIKREYIGANVDEGDWSLQLLFKREKTIGYKNTYSRENQETEDGCIDEATRELLMLESMLRVTYTSPRTMHWITRLLRRLLLESQQGAAILDESKLISELRAYACEKVNAAFCEVEEQPQGFSIERIVFTYLDYLLWKKRRAEANFKFTFRNSIEHFYPQNPRDGQSGKGKISPDKLNYLGNLALVSVSDNSRFSNDLPETKATYDKIVQQSPKLALMARLAEKKETKWDDQQMCDHHKEMIDLLEKDLQKNCHKIHGCES